MVNIENAPEGMAAIEQIDLVRTIIITSTDFDTYKCL